MEEERTYIMYECAIENIAYAMGVLRAYAEARHAVEDAALKVAYNRLERVMEALQDGGIVGNE